MSKFLWRCALRTYSRKTPNRAVARYIQVTVADVRRTAATLPTESRLTEAALRTDLPMSRAERALLRPRRLSWTWQRCATQGRELINDGQITAGWGRLVSLCLHDDLAGL